jgi:glutamate-ammonia-ligase adenylyltransferase
MADVLRRLDIDAVGDALSDLSEATLAGAFDAAVREVEDEIGELPTRLAVVLMGRLGGHEAGYSSDADVMFVHDPLDGASDQEAGRAATLVATRLRTILSSPSEDPPLEVDAELRPDGKNGPLVRTFAAYRAYYDQWSAVWEAQALLRARPAIGDADLCERFAALIDPLRYPDAGVGPGEITEIRRIKARVDAERLPRGANPHTHLKLGRGGLTDVEWTVQLLQLQHAHAVEGLRTTRTLPALAAASEAGLVSPDEVVALAESWRLVSRVRNAAFLARGRASDSLPEDPHDRAAVAALLGYHLGHSEQMVDDYLRVTRRARRVVESVFYR